MMSGRQGKAIRKEPDKCGRKSHQQFQNNKANSLFSSFSISLFSFAQYIKTKTHLRKNIPWPRERFLAVPVSHSVGWSQFQTSVALKLASLFMAIWPVFLICLVLWSVWSKVDQINCSIWFLLCSTIYHPIYNSIYLGIYHFMNKWFIIWFLRQLTCTALLDQQILYQPDVPCQGFLRWLKCFGLFVWTSVCFQCDSNFMDCFSFYISLLPRAFKLCVAPSKDSRGASICQQRPRV